MQLGLHIANFTWDNGAPAIGTTMARHVRDAEAAGVARITVMDHFWQIRDVGPIEHAMLEAYTTLGFIASHTSTALLHALVTGVTYRELALLAKAVTTLDVLSGGRAGLGIGAAWNAEESAGLGFRFPPTRERFERLEEAIQICRQMWSDSEDRYDGTHYHLDRTLNSPQPLHRPYLMIGGVGEKRTLRLVAQYADACNLFPNPDVTHKLDVLHAHCDKVGRNYDHIEKTISLTLSPHETADDPVRKAEGMRDLGFTAAYVLARDITNPTKVIDILAQAVPRLS
jgi:F420-dependent oxidoreductase-like protein